MAAGLNAAETTPSKRYAHRIPKTSLVGMVLLGTVVLAALAAPLLTSWSPTEVDFEATLSRPGSNGHLLGTDSNGMDVFSRLLYGARFDLAVAVVSVSVSVFLGSTLGAIVGFAGGWLDELVMRTMDVLQSLPGFILALVVATALGAGFVNLILALTVVSAPNYVRLMRAEVRGIREEPWVEAARASGASWFGLLFGQIVPNALRPVLVIAPLACGWSVLALAALSFVGLGVQLPNPEWGTMIAAAVDDLSIGVWWTSAAPGMALLIAVLGFNLTSEGFQEARR